MELHDANWESDVAHLIASLEKTLDISRQEPELADGGTQTELTQQLRQSKVARGTIRVKRRRGLQELGATLRDKPVYLLVDDEVVATLRRDQSVEVDVDTGRHVLYLQNKEPGRWFVSKSDLLPINVREGEVISCICGYNPYPDLSLIIRIRERRPTRGE
jgi:hypothetical protein